MSQYKPAKPYKNSLAGGRKLLNDKPPQCPETLREFEGAEAHFSWIVAHRIAQDWSPHDLAVASQLAITMSLVDAELMALNLEGTLVGIRGKMVPNSRVQVLSVLSNSANALRRALRLFPDTDPRQLRVDPKARAIANRNLESDDDLIG